jgi:uncharacterized protein YjiS (DUF1127 family)
MSVLNLITSAWEAVADWRRRQRAYTGLMALDDHSLADIGICRSNIRDLCEGSYARVRRLARRPQHRENLPRQGR